MSQWIVLLFVGCAIATPFRRPYNEVAREKRLIQLDDSQTAQVEAHANYEDDIKLTARDLDFVDTSTTGDEDGKNITTKPSKRSSTHRNVNYLWIPRVIYYLIDESLAAEKSIIEEAIAIINKQSCVQWVKVTSEPYPYHVKFMKLSGCWSYIGKTNDARGYQEISIGANCAHIGIILHEILHCMGFWHEQSRPDRNTQVEIMWENILKGKESNFNKYDSGTLNGQNTDYDLKSIMQYGNGAFSANGKMTIRRIADPTATFGQRDALSSDDVLALKNFYSCSVINGGWSVWTSYSPCDANCKKVRSKFCTNVDKAACDANKADGIEHETVVCPDAECNAPVDGHYGRWSAWGPCSKTCDEGTATRTRICDDPPPKNGGKNCVVADSSMTGPCKVKSCGGGPGDCEFDDDANGFCDWQQVKSDLKASYKDFKRGSSTPSGGTGPQSGDHTTKNGKFLYSETSDCINTVNNFVQLQSVEFTATGINGRCMTFWYLANGAMVGDFFVYLNDNKQQLFKFDGEKGTEWRVAKVHLTHTTGNYRILLESRCGLDYRGDFAIDDIKFTDGACPT